MMTFSMKPKKYRRGDELPYMIEVDFEINEEEEISVTMQAL